MKNRINKLREVMRNNELEGVLIISIHKPNPNIYYFTGLKDMFPMYLWIDDEKSVLFCYDERLVDKNSQIEVVELEYLKDALDQISKKVETKGKEMGIEFSLPFNLIQSVKKKLKPSRIVDISNYIKEMRAEKDEGEIKRIKSACKISDVIFQQITERCFWRMNSNEVLWTLRELFVRNRVEEAFEPIINYDESTSFVHQGPCKERANVIALIDMGVRFEGYCSDATRLFISKRVDLLKKADKLVEVLDELKAQIKAGMQIKDVCMLAEEKMSERFGKDIAYFNFHSIGHGVGLEVHEYPLLRKDNDSKLRENMVITLEPAIYTKKYGMRVESVFLVKKTKLKELNVYAHVTEIS